MQFSDMKKSVMLEADGGFKTVYSMPEPQPPPIIIDVEMPALPSVETKPANDIPQSEEILGKIASNEIVKALRTVETFLREHQLDKEKTRLTRPPSKISLEEAHRTVLSFARTHPKATERELRTFIDIISEKINDAGLLKLLETK